jgi:putative phage-type endonuclease
MIPFDSHDEWLAIRRGYIGGSDAGSIVGMNPYNSAFAVWAEKTGKTEPFGGNIATRTGTLLEDLVARLFMEETGKSVQRLNFTLVNEAYPFACANLDREIIGEDAFLECKTTNNLVNVKKFRNGEFPDVWYAQVTHYMAVTGAKKAYLAVLSECRDFRIFELERDEDEITALMDAERNFWNNYVLTGNTPPADGHSATSSTIREMFPTDDGDTADLTECEADLALRRNLSESMKDIKAEIDEIDNKIKLRMGEASKGTCGRFTVSWKLQNTSGLDREKIKADYPDIDFSKYTSQSRVYRVTEKKAKTA